MCLSRHTSNFFIFYYLFLFFLGGGGGEGTDLCSLSTLKQSSVTLWLCVSHSGVIIAYGHKIPSLPKLF